MQCFTWDWDSGELKDKCDWLCNDLLTRSTWHNWTFKVSTSVICKPLHTRVSSYKSYSNHSTHVVTLQECVMYYFGAQTTYVSVTRIKVLKSARVVSAYFRNLLMLIREGVNIFGKLLNALVLFFVLFLLYVVKAMCVWWKVWISIVQCCNLVWHEFIHWGAVLER